MERIKSFTIDHTKLKAGVYVSRKDFVGNEILTTFDIRLKKPNVDQVITPESIHSMEHLAATYLRNHNTYGEKTIYFGPMGCLTGVYWVVAGDYTSRDVLCVLRDLFEYISTYTGEIPGASPVECGNYTMMDLEQTKRDAQEFLINTLQNISEDQLEYPA
ncbi:MAG: S-ribosylhomocysteine lyase [Desulfovibrio sp.]